jgi:nicotinamide N-methyltransferase
MTSDDGHLAGDTDLFKEPDDYYPPEKPATFVEHILQSGQELRLRLVGHNPLWV